jgi:hypothetical protein
MNIRAATLPISKHVAISEAQVNLPGGYRTDGNVRGSMPEFYPKSQFVAALPGEDPLLFLSGYNGGQVDTACLAIE